MRWTIDTTLPAVHLLSFTADHDATLGMSMPWVTVTIMSLVSTLPWAIGG